MNDYIYTYLGASVFEGGGVEEVVVLLGQVVWDVREARHVVCVYRDRLVPEKATIQC